MAINRNEAKETLEASMVDVEKRYADFILEIDTKIRLASGYEVLPYFFGSTDSASHDAYFDDETKLGIYVRNLNSLTELKSPKKRCSFICADGTATKYKGTFAYPKEWGDLESVWDFLEANRLTTSTPSTDEWKKYGDITVNLLGEDRYYRVYESGELSSSLFSFVF